MQVRARKAAHAHVPDRPLALARRVALPERQLALQVLRHGGRQRARLHREHGPVRHSGGPGVRDHVEGLPGQVHLPFAVGPFGRLGCGGGRGLQRRQRQRAAQAGAQRPRSKGGAGRGVVHADHLQLFGHGRRRLRLPRRPFRDRLPRGQVRRPEALCDCHTDKVDGARERRAVAPLPPRGIAARPVGHGIDAQPADARGAGRVGRRIFAEIEPSQPLHRRRGEDVLRRRDGPLSSG
mmetsp:Transcript_30899/g.104061  ORF Transcript_30899/g.104061 Transcript_30899/m.104061 type:complete len:237 (+) Transcript_30899:250-960(+)